MPGRGGSPAVHTVAATARPLSGFLLQDSEPDSNVYSSMIDPELGQVLFEQNQKG